MEKALHTIEVLFLNCMKKIIFVLTSAFSPTEESNARNMIDTVCLQYGKEYEIFSCHSSWEKEVRRLVKNNAISKMVALGGDGTVNMVAQLVVHTGIPLGIVPQGTANILAKTMGIPLTMQEALEFIVNSKNTIVIDALLIGETYFFTHITVGLSSYITKETAASEKKLLGFFAYFAKGLQKVLTVPFHRFYLILDGTLIKKRAVDVVIANIPLFLSTRFSLDDDIKLDDGMLDIIILRPRFIKDFIALFFRFLSKKKSTLGEGVFSKFRGKELQLTNHKPLPVHADGEIIGRTPITVRVAEQCLRLIK